MTNQRPFLVITEFSSLEYRLNATQNQKPNIGGTIDEVFENLVTIGQMLTMESNDDDLNKMEDIHAVMNNVYGGSYSVYNMMLEVNQ